MDSFHLKALEDSTTFERLCADVLIAEGCLNVRGIGTGPDQGSDILIDVPNHTPLLEETVPFIVQCKWYSDGNTVGEREISDVLGYLSLHNAKGLLLITSSRFSGTAVTKANAIDRDTTNPYRVLLWDAAELWRRIRRHPFLVARYWYSSSEYRSVSPSPDRLPKYEFHSFVEQFQPPTSYASMSIATFPKIDENASAVEALHKFAKRYTSFPPIVTIVTGIIGSGKTGFAYSLLNEKQSTGAIVAGLSHSAFIDFFTTYELEGDDRLPQLIACFTEVDFLLLDDFGFELLDDFPVQRSAAETLIEIVRRRITLDRPTILTTYDNHSSQTIADYVSFLKGLYPTVNCGDAVDLRLAHGTTIRVSLKSEIDDDDHPCQTDAQQVSKFAGTWLSRSWLSAKLHNVETGVEYAIQTLQTPTEDYKRIQDYYDARGIKRQTRKLEAVQELKATLGELIHYRQHIESLPWNALFFTVDGPKLIDLDKKDATDSD